MAAKEGLRTLAVTSGVSENGGVAVSIADTGKRHQVAKNRSDFQPTVDNETQRHGDGLFIRRFIVESHGGNLLVFPNSPQGAAFQMVLHPNPIQHCLHLPSGRAARLDSNTPAGAADSHNLLRFDHSFDAPDQVVYIKRLLEQARCSRGGRFRRQIRI